MEGNTGSILIKNNLLMSKRTETPERVVIYHNGVCKYECHTEHEAAMYLFRTQPRSILYAITEGGWNVRVEYKDMAVEWNEEYYGI